MDKEQEEQPQKETQQELIPFARLVSIGDLQISSNDPSEDLGFLIALAKSILKDKTFKNYLKVVDLKKNGDIPSSIS